MSTPRRTATRSAAPAKTPQKGAYPSPVRRTRPRRRGRAVVLTLMKILFVGWLFASAAYGIVHYIKSSPRYLVSRVSVVGTNLVPAQDVVNAAGITSGDNLMTLDTEAIQERVRKIPYIHTCNVQRSYPDRVVIEVSERHPGAMVMISNHAFEIDDECVVLGLLNPIEPYDGPTITNLPNVSAVTIGQRIDSPALLAALEVWKAFTTVPMSQKLKLSELSAASPDHISMYLDGLPFEIIWGRSDFLTQARRLDTLWQRQGGILPCKQSLSLQFDTDLVCR